ncbi:DNA endonuclease RBBP8 isoform X3 [Hypomesus transpacificus]|uniref:DNA endonuclease RBBP8 isoform X3 n=1 Tax=Hypomesus transpacificus TaxID=137520 RepID=UPI001F076BA9|nr:DNA endonuclease RBBP8 isoform X3 [Hypomesus transpacificus]
MMSHPGLRRDSPPSSRGLETCSNFHNLWSQLKECHDDALEGLQEKVNHLKKKRCLDAQKLEGLFKQNQQLQGENKVLQDTVTVLEQRLRIGNCDRCTVTDEHMRTKQVKAEDDSKQSLQVIAKLMAERDCLQEEKRKLNMELDRLKETCWSREQEEVIPDSPLKHICLAAVNKRKRRNESLVNYEEPVSIDGASEGRSSLACLSLKKDLLVPETCEMDTSRAPQSTIQSSECAMVTDTCYLDFPDRLLPNLAAFDLQAGSENARNWILWDGTKSNHRSLSSSPVFGKSVVASANTTEDSSPALLQSTMLRSPGLHLKAFDIKESNSNSEAPEGPNPNNSPQTSTTPGKLIPVEPMWSLDPELTLSQYDIDTPTTVERNTSCSSLCHEQRQDGVVVDVDCTFVSHSLLLQGLSHKGQDKSSTTHEIGQKANNSMEDVFDQTTFGEFESCPLNKDSHLDHHQELAGEEAHKPQNQPVPTDRGHKDSSPVFAHVSVVRSKEERRKLKGHTCKECEIYYADLPEAEKIKKLSACSRHRFHYIPPSTPENFWEVGFPSTQTCLKRGYFKEDIQPEQRIRRRQPYNAIFSPKVKEQKNQ